MNGHQTLLQHDLGDGSGGTRIDWIGIGAADVPAGQMSETQMRPEYSGHIGIIKPTGSDRNSKERVIFQMSVQDRRCFYLTNDRGVLNLRSREKDCARCSIVC